MLGIKKHMKERNEYSSLSTVHHVKKDRNNYEEAAYTEYEKSVHKI